MLNVFLTFLRLGLTSFGGPIAHLGYFREEFVVRRKWLSESSYSEIVALCQFLPGPASSQVGLIVGLSRAGTSGAFAAWLGFTLPSAIAITLFAIGGSQLEGVAYEGFIHGLKIVAVAIIAHAIWGMTRSLCPDVPRAMIMVVSTVLMILFTSAFAQVAVIIIAAILGIGLTQSNSAQSATPLPIAFSVRSGLICLCLFSMLLVGLPLVAYFFPSQIAQSLSSFYRAGSLVFGGGHVVLPLLQAEVVTPGLVSNETFLAGYGAAQAVPGPLFTFASFLGASIYDGALGWYGSLVCLIAIFVPSFLLVFGVLPFWGKVRTNSYAQRAIAGANAGVVGLLIAVLWDPVWTSTVKSISDIVLVLGAFAALMIWKLPSWLVVLGCALSASLFNLIA